MLVVRPIICVCSRGAQPVTANTIASAAARVTPRQNICAFIGRQPCVWYKGRRPWLENAAARLHKELPNVSVVFDPDVVRRRGDGARLRDGGDQFLPPRDRQPG